MFWTSNLYFFLIKKKLDLRLMTHHAEPNINVLLHTVSDNLLSPVSITDWLIFCCGNLILHQKGNEKDKNRSFLIKSNKKVPRNCMQN